MTHDDLLLPEFARSGGFPVSIDGENATALSGETVSALLIRVGRIASRNTRLAGEPRGYFCGMGACYECQVRVDGRVLQGCLVPARPGMQIETDATAPAEAFR